MFVIGGRVVGAMMRVAAKGNFKANVHQGGTVRKVKLSAQVRVCVCVCFVCVLLFGLRVGA